MVNIHKNLYRSKRGDLPITLLVVMTLALCVISSFVFLTTQNSYEKGMQQVRVIPATYANEEAFMFYIKNLAQGVMVANPQLDEKAFIKNFQAQYVKENISEYNLPNFKTQIMNDTKYQINIKNNTLSFRLNNFQFSRSFYYDPGTKQYIFWYVEFGSTARLEAVSVKHTGDLVFEIAF